MEKKARLVLPPIELAVLQDIWESADISSYNEEVIKSLYWRLYLAYDRMEDLRSVEGVDWGNLPIWKEGIIEEELEK